MTDPSSCYQVLEELGSTLNVSFGLSAISLNGFQVGVLGSYSRASRRSLESLWHLSW